MKNKTHIPALLAVTTLTVSSIHAATLTVDGTTLNHSTVNSYDTITVNNGGILNLTGGAVTVPQQSPSNNTEKIYVSNGSVLNFVDGVHTLNERIAAYGDRSTIRVTGDKATINVHQQSFFDADLEFIFNSTGVSTFDSDSRLGFGGDSILVDASDYTGASATFVLVDVDWLSASSGFGGTIDIVAPTAEWGYTYEYDQSQIQSGLGQITFTLTAIPEPSSTVLLGLGLSSLLLRRRRS